MSAIRISKEKRGYVIGALIEGTPINAVCRMFKVSKTAVLRVIEETGAALGDYMDSEFRDLPCGRVELDEQWQYVAKHGQRMTEEEKKEDNERGDFWLWAAIDPDTKLVVSHRIGCRGMATCDPFISDLAHRITGPVQITSDEWTTYEDCIIQHFDTPKHAGYSYATEKKVFKDKFDAALFPKKRTRAVDKIVRSEREQAIGLPDLRVATTSHVERLFLTVRQEIARFTRQTLAYSKKLSMHKAAVSMHLGVYNLCRKHTTLGTTPAVAAGVEEKPWTIEMVVDLTEAYVRRMEDAKFEAAFAAAA